MLQYQNLFLQCAGYIEALHAHLISEIKSYSRKCKTLLGFTPEIQWQVIPSPIYVATLRINIALQDQLYDLLMITDTETL